MLSQLCDAWRARRVLVCGSAQDAAPQLCAWLAVLGARPICLPPEASCHTIYRALTDGRVSAALICPRPAPQTLLREIRETGVPFTLLLAPGDAQEAALHALHFGARFFIEGDMPCGVYDLAEEKALPE